MAEAKSYAQRNRQGSDWFSHDDNAVKTSPEHKATESDHEVTEDKNGEMESSSARTQMIKPVCNSNQWYKYEGKEETDEIAPSGGGKEKMHTPHQSGGDWYSHEEKNAEKAADVKVRVGSTEGQAYCQRDKTGSSSSWFAHEHKDGQTTETSVSSPRVNSTEGSSNANRMRSQSENWFGHDEKGDLNGPQHTSKGRGNRPQSSDMHQIFHMGSE